MGRKTHDIGVYSDTNDKNPFMNWGFAISSESGYIPVKENESFKSSHRPDPVLIYDKRIADLQKEVKELREMLTRIGQSLSMNETEIVNLRDIPYKQAKKEVKDYFEAHHGETIYSYNLVEDLKIDFDIVDKILGELEKEKQIKEIQPHD